ncbi:hydroxylamine reductase [Myxococcota bacterium]|nr:hydroxylamine reductase [Myxococcota bacterium]MBU1382219.1 hydroxylamine reductase [Myxococcota bacterium]MBU1498331.1 hydroxylamine reductase [Myxococcota bacterium]
MSMFCYQCQETAKNTGCTMRGVCGKTEETSNLQDVLLDVLKGLARAITDSKKNPSQEQGLFIANALFATITNANFDSQRIINLISEGLAMRNAIIITSGLDAGHASLSWNPTGADYENHYAAASYLAVENEDVRSLNSLVIFGIKGISAYYTHALHAGKNDESIPAFLVSALDALTREKSADDLVALVMETGKTAVTTMALLDSANTSAYGNPEITKVNIGTRGNPAILISGHDLKDMEWLLEQTKDTGVDVYTHSEMLPANYYPAFKKYSHFVGNYGNAWWKQDTEFASFNGPILMTTNCIVPVKEAYKDRIFTTGMAGYPGVKHISEMNGKKDFSEIIEMAKKCPPPIQIEEGSIIGGFAHHQVMALADKVIEAVKSGAIKKFVVMAGCDGRHKSRQYFTDVASQLPEDSVILTAGCAKYRYNKLNLGDIGGIPRVLDAGQCNDSYSLAVIALKLKEVFGLEDINDLPIEYDIAWYEQKAVAVLLALLYLGVKNIRLGPTLPAFLSPAVAGVLVEKFGIKGTKTAEEDVREMTM